MATKKTYNTEETREDRIVRARNHHYHRRDRRAAAIDRQQATAKLSADQRLARLDDLLGAATGAVKERRRLGDDRLLGYSGDNYSYGSFYRS